MGVAAGSETTVQHGNEYIKPVMFDFDHWNLLPL